MTTPAGPRPAGPHRWVDAHVHLWDVTGGPHRVTYPWLTPAAPAIYRTFTLDDARSDMDRLGVSGLVLVQASDSLAETRALVAAAEADDRPVTVVGWLPLDDPDATARELAARAGPLVGVRHLIHDDPDPRWLLRPTVGASLDLLARAGLVFDAVAERPDLLALVPTVARRHPGLTIVLDHLGKPPFAAGDWSTWRFLMAAAAAEPNVVAKISGLNTACAPGWSVGDWMAAIAPAVDLFGPQRLMLGGDWPFCLQADPYDRVALALWEATQRLDGAAAVHVRELTARRVYRLGPAGEAGAGQNSRPSESSMPRIAS